MIYGEKESSDSTKLTKYFANFSSSVYCRDKVESEAASNKFQLDLSDLIFSIRDATEQ